MITKNIDLMKHDIYRDLYFFNIARHENINTIKKINNIYMVRFGDMFYKLNATNIEDVVYFLNHINNAIDIIPLIDNDGVKLGLFYRNENEKFIFVRQLYVNKKVGV